MTAKRAGFSVALILRLKVLLIEDTVFVNLDFRITKSNSFLPWHYKNSPIPASESGITMHAARFWPHHTFWTPQKDGQKEIHQIPHI